MPDPSLRRKRGKAGPEHRTLSLEGSALVVVVVADSHGRPHPRALEHVAALEPNAILHAGDIGSASVLDDLGRIAPVLAVRGNIDAPSPETPESMSVDVVEGSRLLLRLLLLHIGVYGPKLRADAARLARREQATLVICGHSHVPFIGRDAGISVFNPGSIGPRRFQLPIVFGVLELDRERVRMRHVDCETGQTWEPLTTRAS